VFGRRLTLLAVVALLIGVLTPVTSVLAEMAEPDATLEAPDDTTESGRQFDDTSGTPWDPPDLSIPTYEPSPETTKRGLAPASDTLRVAADGSRTISSKLPLSVAADRRSLSTDLSVDVVVLDQALAHDLSPVGAAFEITAKDDQGSRMSAEAVSVEFDYADVALTSGADVINRLQMVQYDGCVLDAEGVYTCKNVQMLPTENDPENRRITFSPGEIPQQVVAIQDRGLETVFLPGTTIVALATLASSVSGDFEATPMASVLDYQVGLFSGSAELSYPIDVPSAAAGPTPAVELTYSSGTVDGLHPRSNNQASDIGLGWSYHPGAITRAYSTCSDGTDRHFCPDEDDSDNYTLQLNGVASQLVQIPGTNQFRLQNDPYWRIEHHESGPEKLVNGGFETGDFAPWSPYETVPGAGDFEVIAADPEFPGGDSTYAVSVGTGGGEAFGYEQIVTLPQYEGYEYSVWVRQQPGTSGAKIRLEVAALDGTWVAHTEYQFEGSEQEWVQLSKALGDGWRSTHPQEVRFRILLVESSAEWSSVEFDGASLTRLVDYWSATTPDGTSYGFGEEFEQTSAAAQNSRLYAPVDSSEECGGAALLLSQGEGSAVVTASGSVCPRPYQWNLDRIEDTSGNVVSYFYEREINYYGVGSGQWEYVRAANLARIEYSKVAGQEGDTHNAQVLFNTEWRCGDSESTFGDCEADYPDTPSDLACEYGSSACTQESPTFWSERRLGSIQTQTRLSTVDPWVTVGFYDLEQFFPNSGGGVSVEPKLWLQRIYDRGNRSLDSVGTTPYGFSAFEQIEAEYYSSESGTSLVRELDMRDIGGGRAVVWWNDTDSLVFQDVDFGNGIAELLVRGSAMLEGTTVSFATTPGGNPFAQVSLTNNGAQSYELAHDITFSGAPTGVTDIYVDLEGAGRLNWFRFKPSDTTPFGPANEATTHYPAAESAALDNFAAPSGYPGGFPMLRIGEMVNELNGEVIFTYGQHSCDGQSTPLGGVLTNNEFHCYPILDPTNPQATWVYVNKYVVSQTEEVYSFPQYPGSPVHDAITTYEYGDPRWAKDISPVLPLNETTWNVFRGHPWVEVTQPDGTVSKHWFYQGMNHDYTTTCGATSCPERPTQYASASAGFVLDPELDEYWLVGRTSVVEFFASAADLAADDSLTQTITEYSDGAGVNAVRVTAGSGPRAAARFIAPSRTTGSMRPTLTSPFLETQTDWFYDIYGNTIGEKRQGDTNLTGDESYLARQYNINAGAWIIDRLMHERLWETAEPGSYGDGSELWISLYAYDDGEWIPETEQWEEPTQGLLTDQWDWIERNGDPNDPNSPPDVKVHTHLAYDDRGRLVETTDPEGSTPTAEYDPFTGQVEWVENDLQHRTTYGYDGYGRLDSVTDPNGHEVTVSYDGHDRVTSVQQVTSAYPSGADVVRYAYHDTSNPVWIGTEQAVYDTAVGGVVYAPSNTIYDGFGQVFQTEASSPTASRVATNTIHDEMGRVTRITEPYDDNGPLGQADIINIDWGAVPVWHRYEYDPLGNAVTEETRDDDGVRGTTTLYEIATAAAVIDPDGSPTTCNCVRSTVTDAENNATDYYRDTAGKLRRVDEWNNAANYVTTYGYDDAGRLTTVHDYAANVTSIEYDLAGRKTSMDDPDMGLWSYEYDDVGNLIRQTDARETDVYFSYDGLHRLLKRSTDLSDPGATIAEYSYDAAGFLGLPEWSRSFTSEGVVETAFESYDESSRLTEETWTIPGDFGGIFTVGWDYDLAGNLRAVTYPAAGDPAQSETLTYEYDAYGRPVSADGDVTYVDDAVHASWGALTSMDLPGGSSTLTREFDYWPSRRLRDVSAGTNPGADNVQSLEISSYDDVDNITAITDDLNAGQRQCFAYDDLNRLTGAFTTDDVDCETADTGVGSYGYDQSFTYNPIGNLVTRSDIPGSFVYGAAGTGPHALTSIGQSHSFTYDDNGNQLTRALPGLNQTLTWSDDNRLDTVSDGTTETRHIYDADGNRVMQIVEGETVTEVTVYIAGLYERTTSTGSSLLWDPVELVMSSDDPPSLTQSAVVTTSDSGELPSLSVVDDAAWLTSVDLGSGSFDFTADPAGLSPGVYEATATVSGDGYDDGLLPVTLTVVATPVWLVWDPVELVMSSDDVPSLTQSAVVTTSDSGELPSLSVVDDAAWLTSVDLGSGSFDFTADPDGLSPDVYEATVTVSGEGYDDGVLPVTLTVVGGVENILENPGFEDGFTGWSMVPSDDNPSTAILNSTDGIAAPHEGDYATAVSNVGSGFLESAAVSVSGGGLYDWGVWLRGEVDSEGSPGDGGWAVEVVSFDGTTELESVVVASGDGSGLSLGWGQESGSVTVAAAATSVRLRLRLVEASGWVAFDDVSLSTGGGGNLVMNPGFEAPWGWSEVADGEFPATGFVRSTWGIANQHWGSYGYAISNLAYGYVYSEPVAVTPGVSYDVSAWVRGELDPDESHETTWKVRAQFYNAQGGPLSYDDVAEGLVVPSSWTLEGDATVAPANAASMVVRLYVLHGSGWVTFDDVSVTTGGGGNLVSDPGFEDVPSAWTEQVASGFPGTGLWRGDWGPAEGRSGSNGYTITNHATGSILSDAHVVSAGESHDVSAWIRGEADTDDGQGQDWALRARFYDGGGALVSSADVASGDGSGLPATFTEYGDTVVVPQGAVTARVELAFEQATGWIAFDDVALMGSGGSGGGDNLVPNPGFENGTTGWIEVADDPATGLVHGTSGVATPHSDSYGYGITNVGSGFLESAAVSVSGGGLYDWGVWLRGEVDSEGSPGDGGWAVEVVSFDGTTELESVVVASGDGSGLSLGWGQESGSVTVAAAATSVRLRLRLVEASGWVAFDDVSLSTGGGGNLVMNPGFEAPWGWSEVADGEFPATGFVRSTWGIANQHWGSYGYAISNLAYGYVYSEPVAVTPGVSYDVSAWVRGELDPDESHETTWKVRAQFYNAQGGPLSYDDVAEGLVVPSSWTLEGDATVAPANAASMVVRLYVLHGSGWVTFDDVSVTTGGGGNLVSDPGFEDVPSAWTEQVASGFPGTGLWRGDWGPAEGRSGSNGYTITNHATGYLESDAISVSAGLIDVGAWLRGEVDGDDSFGESVWRVSVAWFDAGEALISESVVEEGEPGDVSETWTERGGIIQRPMGAVTARVRLRLETASGWVTFDDASLVELTGAMAAAMSPVTFTTAATPVAAVEPEAVVGDGDTRLGVLTAGDGAVVSETVYYQFDGSLVAMRRDGDLYYLLGDHLGSTSVSYRVDGSETLRQFYYPWGGLRGSSEPAVPTDVGFTGQRLDASTGLMLYQARYYDPLVGRFISADSIVPDPTDPQNLNRYSYVQNNPVTNTDPSGHCVIAGQQIYAGPCRQTGSSSWDYGYDYGALDDPDTNGCVNCRDDSYYWRDAVGDAPVIGAIGDASEAVAQRASDFWDDNKDWIMPVLEAAKNVAVVAAAIAAVDAFCAGTAGLGCPIAVGSVTGALANWAGDESLDCIGGDCLHFSGRELAGQLLGGVVLGGTGGALGAHAARYVDASGRAIGLWSVARGYGLAMTIEIGLVQSFPRIVRSLTKRLIDILLP